MKPRGGTVEVRCRVEYCSGLPRPIATAWITAARDGDMATVKALLRDVGGGGTTQHDDAQQSAAAITRGGDDAGGLRHRLLHYSGAGLTIGFVGNTALHWAAANGDAPMVAELVRAGAAVNAQNNGGSTPLHTACAHRRADIVALLLAHGASTTQVDCCGETPRDVLLTNRSTSMRTPSARGAPAPAFQPGIKASGRDLTAVAALLDVAGLADALKSVSNTTTWRPVDMRRLVGIAATLGWIHATTCDGTDRAQLVAKTQEILRALQQRQKAAESAERLCSQLQRDAFRRKEEFERLYADRRAADDENAEAEAEAEAGEGSRALPRRGSGGDGPREPSSSISVFDEESRRAAATAKAKGNEAFAAGDYRQAVRYYTVAVGIDPRDATFYSNRCAAYLKLAEEEEEEVERAKGAEEQTGGRGTAAAAGRNSRHDARGGPPSSSSLSNRVALLALQDAKDAVALKPDWAKAYHRLGHACLRVGREDEAIEAFQEGLSLAPGDDALSEGLMCALKRAASASPPPDYSDPRPTAPVGATPTPTSETLRRSNETTIPQPGGGGKRPWFDCPICENRTRDRVDSPCCGRALCGTCLKRKVDPALKRCPFHCHDA